MDYEAPAFIDTNVLVYAFDRADSTGHRSVAQLLSPSAVQIRMRALLS